MTYLSEDGEEGYPGAVLSTVRFRLTPDNRLEINIRATTTNSTIENISHGSLFNLAGHVINMYPMQCCAVEAGTILETQRTILINIIFF